MNTLMTPHSRDVELLIAALAYADANYPIYPIYPKGHRNDPTGKRPAIAKWNELATTDLDTVEGWYGFTHVGFNIGLAVPAHLLTVDIDRHSEAKDGMAYLEALEELHGLLPETLTAYTGGGGEHRYYLKPITPRPLNLMALAAHGIDLLTDGHGAILPPSESASGPYRWLDPAAPIVALPEWFSSLITRPAPKAIWQAPPKRINYQGNSPIDRFEERFGWSAILTSMVPNPWQVLSGGEDNDGDSYSHPEALGRTSATIKHGRLFCFSTSTPLPVSAASDPHGLTRFKVWRLLNGYSMAEARGRAQALTGGAVR